MNNPFIGEINSLDHVVSSNIIEYNQLNDVVDNEPNIYSSRRGPAQDAPFFYTPSHLSELQSCKSILSTGFPFIFILK